MEFDLHNLVATYLTSFAGQSVLAVAGVSTVVMVSGLGARAIELWERVAPAGR